MKRLASAVLFGGALLSPFVVAPGSRAVPEPVRAGDAAAFDQLPPAILVLAQETGRLRAQMAAPPPLRETKRDPFSFGARREPVRPATKPAVQPLVDLPPPPPPPPSAPRVVAVISEGLAFSVALGVGDDVIFAKAGETVSGFIIKTITADAVEFLHGVSGTLTKTVVR